MRVADHPEFRATVQAAPQRMPAKAEPAAAKGSEKGQKGQDRLEAIHGARSLGIPSPGVLELTFVERMAERVAGQKLERLRSFSFSPHSNSVSAVACSCHAICRLAERLSR